MTGVLLVDGMSVLVRAAKAAARVRTLSYEGVETGTLLMFTGTMARHLDGRALQHVVVAWEGLPELNWRKDCYPAYKSSRPHHADDAPVMSRDEELAREFCAAAGLFQDWAGPYEGDDVIAAWWRGFRDNYPNHDVTILTSDRDLLQLCDQRTIWQAWGNEVMTEADVFAIWGCSPERLPLLRALAGDASDGIPGIRGIGPIRAAQLAGAALPPLDIIRALPVEDEQRDLVSTWYAISNLREPASLPLRIQADFGERQAETIWRPAEHSKAMREFLGRFGMERMIARLDAGKLPWPPVPE